MNRVAIIGIGSPHGDDQFGWAVVDELTHLFPNPTRERGINPRSILCSRVALRVGRINNPVDLIPALDVNERVILVDAAVGLTDRNSFRKLHFAEPRDRAIIQEIPHHGTHDFGLSLTLRMAESLGKRTDHVEFWIGNATMFERLAPMSPELIIVAKQCALAIGTEVCHARTLAG